MSRSPLLVTCALTATAALSAQGVTTAAIGGVVRDDRGEAVSLADVEVLNRATGFVTRARTRADGRYLVSGLEVGGPYTIAVRHIGFERQTRDGIFLTISQTFRLDAELARQAVTLPTVTSTAAMRTESSHQTWGVGTLISDSLIHRLPISDRDFYGLVRLVPQMSTWYGLSGAGASPRMNAVMIDGTSEQGLYGGNASGAIWGGKAISLEAVKEYQVLLSPFGLDLWVSRRASVDDPWGAPENLGPNINSAAVDLAAAFTRDGHWMYYHSAGRGGCGGPDLFVSRRHDKRDDLGWEVAENLGCVVNSSAEDAGPTLWTDDSGVTTMLFNSSRPGGPGELDIYQTTRAGDDGEWSPPTLVAELSGPFRDTRTTISRNKLTLFISSDSRNRIGGLGGQDIWMSTRIDDGSPWSTPVNLGPIVNGATFDGAPSLSWDGTELYFFSDRTTGGFGRNDLYVTRRSRVHP